jgi:prepilin-type N-terminal cleavage/methylation domain-containing protein/prepilin-type processing-associated H-X9-DG protein
MRANLSNAAARAFTLLELLICIVILAILAALLLPALSRAKSKAQTAQCLNQERQLILACLLYAGDADDALPYNLGGDEIKSTVAAGQYLNWSSTVMSWELDPDNTNTHLLTRGGLGPELSGVAAVYRCPNDTVVSDLQAGAGWTRRVRSYSMNAMVGDAGQYTSTGMNVNNPYYRQFFKVAQVPQPSGIFVFIEEHPDSINDGYFLNRPASLEWTDLPASHHDGAANLAFADGHVESHRWYYSSTKPPARPDAAQLPFPVPSAERYDFLWLMSRTTISAGYTSSGYGY